MTPVGLERRVVHPAIELALHLSGAVSEERPLLIHKGSGTAAHVRLRQDKAGFRGDGA
jgi:hypothetical protein